VSWRVIMRVLLPHGHGTVGASFRLATKYPLPLTTWLSSLEDCATLTASLPLDRFVPPLLHHRSHGSRDRFSRSSPYCGTAPLQYDPVSAVWGKSRKKS